MPANTQKYIDLVIRRLEVAFETLGIKTIADCGKDQGRAARVPTTDERWYGEPLQAGN